MKDLVHISPETNEEWRSILKWYSENVGEYLWEGVPIGDHIKVWYNMDQYNRTIKEWESNDYTEGLLGFACWYDYLINKGIYEQYRSAMNRI